MLKILFRTFLSKIFVFLRKFFLHVPFEFLCIFHQHHHPFYRVSASLLIRTNVDCSIFLSASLWASGLHTGGVVPMDMIYENGTGKNQDLLVTSVASGWSPLGWPPEAAGCWAAGTAARRLLEPEPGHTPYHITHSLLGFKTNRWRCTFANRPVMQMVYLCMPYCDSMVLRQNSALN